VKKIKDTNIYFMQLFWLIDSTEKKVENVYQNGHTGAFAF